MTEATLNPTVSQSFSAKEIAEQATMQSFLNCYLRESGEGEVLRSQKLGTDLLIHCFLSHQNIEIFAGLHYYSPTGRHILSFPMYYQSLGKNELLPLDYVTLTALITKELMLASNQNRHQDELLLRVVQSCRNIEHFLQERYKEIPELYGFKRSFMETEQALVFGHHLHPTPKSRQGFSEEDLPLYSPELKASFSSYYFRAHQSIIQEDSNSNETATNLIKKELLADAEVAPEFKQKYCQPDEYSLIPVHPWQAQFLKRKPAVQKLLAQGLLEDLGQQGKAYFPTSSIRTVYHHNSSFMFKFSLNVKITNSLRANLYKELERGVEVSRILNTKIGQELQQKFSEFQIVKDPAYITIKGEEELTSGFATVLRENPFDTQTDATCIISLCQDTITGKSSRLAAIIQQLAQQEKRLKAEVALDWFQRYLKLSLEPILWLYFTYGIAVEAHQQNSVLQLKDGYPDKFLYRDNQGYYYRESFRQKLETILPGISEKSQTFCEDAVIDERLGYYLVMNNLLGLVNAFGVAELIDENLLILEVRKALEKHLSLEQGCSKFLENLLNQSQLQCKGNLLTRFHDMDELVGSVATQSVYVTIHNPLAIQ